MVRFLIISAFFSTTLRAQVSTATLVGTVKDPSGAVVAGATVEAKNLGTALVRTTTSSESGEYTIPNLPAAHYSISITAAGFKTFHLTDIELQVAQQALVNAVLEVGSIGQELTVTAVAPLLATATSSVGQVVNTTAVERMPLNGRSFWQLTQLTPGASYTPGGANIRPGGTSIRSSAVNVTVNGMAAVWTGWSLDGANITEMQLGGTLVQPNIDAIQEFKVEGANMSAEYGHTPTLVNASLKSGTNQFHGNVFEFLRNDAMDARNFFYQPPPGSTRGREVLKRNQFGGTIGGPIRKDKTFFFSDVEHTVLRENQDFNNVVPSAAMRTGDFSELLAARRPVQLVNPANGQPFAGNLIPGNLFSQPANYFLKYLPASNLLQGTTYRAVVTNKLTQDVTRGDIKIDHQLTSKDTLAGRYSVNDNDENDPNPFPAIGSFPLHSRAQSALLTETHIFGPKWISNTRVSYYRSIFLFGGAFQGTNINQQAGVKGFDDTTSVYGFPQIALSGFAAFTGSPSDQRPKSNRIRNWQYAENVSFSSGRHNAKFGAELLHQTSGFYNGSRAVGSFSFQGAYSGNSFSDFLLGYPDNVVRDYFKGLNGNWGRFWSFYAQDNFRVSQNLTLNLGIRAELNGFYNGIRGQKSAFDVTTGKLVIPSELDPSAQALIPQLLNLFKDRIVFTNDLGRPNSIHPRVWDFAPRAGFAWRPGGTERWVLRSAYGIFHVFPDTNTIDNTVATVPFFAIQTVFNDRTPALPTRTWGDFFQGQSAFSANPRPGQPCPFGFAALSCGTPDVDAAALKFRTTYMQQWNLSVQRQLTSTTSIDVAYVGNKTTHMNQNININDPLPGPGAIQGRRPFQQWGGIVYPIFEENANYNSLQSKFEARGWHGLNGLVSYTFSKCIDRGSAERGNTVSLLRLDHAVCDFDLPHNLVTSFNYAIPVGRGHQFLGSVKGLANHVVSGWELSGIMTLRSGSPFSPTVSSDRANTGVGSQRPDVIGTPATPGNVGCWFFVSANPGCDAFASGARDAFALFPAQTRYGTAGRNILRADGLNVVDFTVMKRFPITESKAVEFRAEFFNFLNHPTFATPSTAIDNASAGQVASTLNGPRIVQLALKFRF